MIQRKFGLWPDVRDVFGYYNTEPMAARKESRLDAWHVWFFVAIALFIAEIFTPGFFLACLGFAALVAGTVDLLGGNLIVQFLSICITTFVVLVGIRPFLIQFLNTRKETYPTNYQALIGKIGCVEETIDNREHKGRVNVNGESWRGVSTSVPVIPVGTSVKVLAVDGNKLVVDLL